MGGREADRGRSKKYGKYGDDTAVERGGSVVCRF